MNVLRANTTPLSIQIGLTRLSGDLYTPLSSNGLVLFVHGSGSSRLSPRNRYVAEILYQSKISSLLFDLLTPEEDLDYQNRFNISVLADRLDKVYDWVQEQYPEHDRPIGLFGASTGAAAALQVAAKRGQGIAAVVSRGGRPDLAGANFLSRVKSPTLLIVGGLDTQVLALNQEAYDLLPCRKELRVVPGATHLFEEPGTLELAAQHATKWFLTHFNVK